MEAPKWRLEHLGAPGIMGDAGEYLFKGAQMHFIKAEFN